MKSPGWLLLGVLLAGCAATGVPQDARDRFVETLRSKCGQRFEGALSYAIDPKSEFAGKKISTVVICSANDVRMPVLVGENRSRTWIIARTPAGLDLRHDHRHDDGTPDAVTMYGGLATQSGSALSQSFAADAQTTTLVPGSETNLWTISFSADGSVLTYHLDRHGKPRAEFVMRRVPG